MEMWPALAGLGSAGGVSAGGGVVDGRVRDLEVVDDGTGAPVVRWGWDQPVEGSHAFWLIADGEPVARALDGALGVGLDPGPGGEVEVVAVRGLEGDAPAVGLMGLRTRVRLTWEAAEAADVVAYRVFGDGGTGTVDEEQAVAVVDRMETPVGFDVPVTSGGGGGTIDIGGTYRGAASNAVWAVEIEEGEESWTWEGVDGASGESRELVAGVWMEMGEGLRVRFGGGHAAGDRWEFRVGPRTRWVSGELASGTYRWAVGAVDGAGNVGELSGEVVAEVVAEPGAPSGIAASWDAGELTLRVSWGASAGPDVAAYNVYANWNVVTEELEDWVIEEAPAWVVTEGTELEVVFGAEPGGEVRLYVRAVNGDGVEERNAGLVRVDCLAEAVAALEAPRLTRAVAVAGGHVELGWDQEAPAAAGFGVYSSATGSWGDAVLEEVVAEADVRAGGVGELPGVRRYVWNSGAVGPFAESAVWWGVRAQDGDGVEGEGSGWLAVTPDGTAPGAVAGLRAG